MQLDGCTETGLSIFIPCNQIMYTYSLDGCVLHLATQVECSDYRFRTNPIGNSTEFSREYSDSDSTRPLPIGLRRNPRCRKPIGLGRKISDKIRWDSDLIRLVDSIGHDEIPCGEQPPF